VRQMHQAMRRAIPRVVLAAAILAAAGAILLPRILRPPTGGVGTQPSSLPAGAAWPMFRGSQDLRGVAPGSLGESLALLWRFKAGEAVKSSPSVAGGRVFVGCDDGGVYALKLADGTKAWRFRTGDTVEAAPLVLDGRVYVGSGNGRAYCLDAADGSLKWKYKTGGKIVGSANWVRSADGKLRIVFGSYDNKLHCVDAADGKEVWAYEVDNYINGSPAVGAGKIVFGGCDAAIRVIAAADGADIDQIDAGSYIPGSPALAGKHAFVGHFENELLCVDIDAGDVVWRYALDDGAFFSSPAVDAERVVVGARDGGVHCVRRTDGAKLWMFQTRDDVDSCPVICDGKVVVGSTDGRLYLLRLTDGTKLWSYEIGAPITSSPAVAGGMVVVGAEDGYVYAFGPEK